MKLHLDDMLGHYGNNAMRLARKHIAWYANGLPGASRLCDASVNLARKLIFVTDAGANRVFALSFRFTAEGGSEDSEGYYGSALGKQSVGVGLPKKSTKRYRLDELLYHVQDAAIRNLPEKMDSLLSLGVIRNSIGHVLLYGQVGKERVVLEHHAQSSSLGRYDGLKKHCARLCDPSREPALPHRIDNAHARTARR